MKDTGCLLRFDEGTIVLEGAPEAAALVIDLVTDEPRIGAWRAEACRYEAIMRRLYAGGIQPDDVVAAADHVLPPLLLDVFLEFDT